MNEKKENLVSINLSPFLTPGAIVLAGLIIAAALFFGLKSSSEKDLASTPTDIEQEKVLPAQEAPQIPPENQKVKTSIDDDPIMGNQDTAQIAIVEFSDYECPFCDRFRTQTLGQIKKDYLDTGQAIFVFRDLPLPFHNPAAEREAIAAECAREQGGDEVYYQYHDQIFETSPGNGQGIDFGGLAKIAETLDLNPSQFKNCLQEEKYKDEVAQDTAAATQVGISGTPGFVIGKLDKEGNVNGVVLRGAQPYANFKAVINEQLES